MFSTPERLIKRTGSNKVGRYEFLKLLVEEFKRTKSREAKEQVMANLANFAYDPINYSSLRQLSVLDLFLDQLAEEDQILKHFAMAGLCNLTLDKENKEHIIQSGGIHAITQCLSSDHEDTVLSALTTLMFLVTPQSKPLITSEEVVRWVYEASLSPNPRLANLAHIFLQDYCPGQQVERVATSVTVAAIPLPQHSSSSSQ